MMVELHPKSCVCHGGSWMTLVGQSGSPCAKSGHLPDGSLVVTLDQWRAMGKPHDVEEFDDALGRLSHAIVPRRFERYDNTVLVRLCPYADDGEDALLGEPIPTDNVSLGGARVRCQRPYRKGDVVWLEAMAGAFRTRAEVKDVTASETEEQRLHLSFLDGLAPASLLAPTPRHS
jgi:hypothetical protein